MLEAAVITALLQVTQVQAPNPEDEPTQFFRAQVLVDAGVPDGLGVGFSLAPVPHVRLSVSGLTNVIGFGLRGGLSLVPFASWTLHPIASLDVGRYFTGDVRNVSSEGPSTLRYDFVDATLGLELAFRVIVLRATGGVARVSGTMDDVAVNGTIPSVKLALAFKLN